MTIRKLSARQEKVKAFLVDGKTIRQTAGLCKMTYHQVRHIADDLVYLGHLARRKDVGSAVLFYDAKLPPLGGKPPKSVGIDGSVSFGHTTDDADSHTFRESRVHLNGHISYKIRNVGHMDTIRDKSGYTLGGFTKTSTPKGRMDYWGWVAMDGQKLTITYRAGNNGSNTFVVWPGDVWTSGERALSTGKEILKDRARRVTELLYDLGWRFFEQEVHGTFESGHVNDPRIARMKCDIDSDAPVRADTSPRKPEIEVNDDAANDILVYSPEHILTLYAQDDAIIKRLDRQDIYVARMMDLMDKVLAVQQQGTVAIGNLTADSVSRRNMEGMFA